MPEGSINKVIYPDEELMLNSTRSLYGRIRQLEATVEQQNRQLQSLSTELLLRGHWKPMEFVSELLGFHHPAYMVVLYDFATQQVTDTAKNPEMAMLKQTIFEIFESSFGSQFPAHSCETDSGMNTVLINVPSFDNVSGKENEKLVLDCTVQFLDAVLNQLNVQLVCCMSQCCTHLQQLPEALKTVQRLTILQHSMPGCNRLLYAARLQLEPTQKAFSDSDLVKVRAEALKTRDIPVLHRVFNQYILNDGETPPNMNDLIPLVDHELAALHTELKLDRRHIGILLNAQTALQEVRSIDHLLIVVNDYFSEVDHLPSNEYNRIFTDKESLAADVMHFIDKNYTDPALSLTMISEHLQTDATRIAKAFKSTYGIRPLQYIGKKRSEYAMKLLSSSRITVSDVMTASGFSNRRTFDRVFSRYTGSTPSNFRANSQCTSTCADTDK